MKIKCPSCKTEIDLDNYDLPQNACDDVEIDCENEDCEETLTVGWYATAELR